MFRETILLIALSSLQMQAMPHGAIAVGDGDAKATDAKTEEYFITSGHTDPLQAQEKVMQQCKARGLSYCHIAAWFDQCGAYARSSTQSSTGTGKTRDEASHSAQQSCGGDKDCKTVAAVCDSDMGI